MHRRQWLQLIVPLILFLVGLALGWSFAIHTTIVHAPETYPVNKLRQRIYGTNYLHLSGVITEVDAQLADFDKLPTKGSITLSYVEGLSDTDGHLQLDGGGTLYSEEHGQRQLVTTIEPERCRAFFRRVATSGILNYSDGIIELKKELTWPEVMPMATDQPYTEVHIVIPELNVDKMITVYGLAYELKNYPDIIEYQLLTRTEKEMLELVPKDYPLWR